MERLETLAKVATYMVIADLAEFEMTANELEAKGPLNREVKIWSSASEEGGLPPSDAESWKCTRTIELKGSAQPRVEDAFFNQVIALSQAGLLLLANAKKNAIYAVHLDLGGEPASTCMDYIAEFTVAMLILSFTGTSISPHGEQIYCVQTQAIQQYALDLSKCLPPLLENSGLEKFFCFQASDLGIEMAWDCCAISVESYITVEARQGDGASMSEPLAQPLFWRGRPRSLYKRCIWVSYRHNRITTTNTKCKVEKTEMEKYASIRSIFPITRCAQLNRAL
ncbi:hypothetical protein RchiOBHm_Chr4g0389321 [Rosa chinensis]|uniref:Uncharacterized protein n=1 Tax=Rosa chinensis TaxID=74649 RepID=A0A2P6QPZ7_ROSCH|nr:hypothetical protein RchiOBHm_Chr4g0389321 [Rosa chinensis]